MNSPDPVSEPIVSHKASVADFQAFAEQVRKSRSSLQKVARAPNAKRKYRPLRLVEALRFSGVNRKRFQDWLSEKHPETASARMSAFTVEQIHQMQDDLKIRPGRPANKGALRLLFTNFKGGSQKTTTTLHAVHYFGLRGYRVLVIDTDPQATLTQHMGIDSTDVANANTIGVVYGTPNEEGELFKASLAPIPTHLDGVDVLPANLSLTSLDFSIARLFVDGPETGRRYVHDLDSALREIEHRYDLVLIDSPPSFSFMALAMSWISDGVIVPMATQVPDFVGTGDFCENIAGYNEILQEWYGVEKSWAPTAFVHARVAGGAGSDLVYTLAGGAFGTYRINAYVPESKPVSNCLTVFKSVFEATSTDTDAKGLSRAREAYFLLCERIESLLAEGWSIKPVLSPPPPAAALDVSSGAGSAAQTVAVSVDVEVVPEEASHES